MSYVKVVVRALAIVGAAAFTVAACQAPKPPVLVSPGEPGVGCPVGAGVTLVTSCDMHGWTFGTSGTSRFVSGPPTPPEGLGSVELAPGGAISTNRFAGLRLVDIADLQYSFSLPSDPGGGEAPVLTLAVDDDGNGTPDGEIVITPDPGGVLIGQWQRWDSLAEVEAYAATHANATVADVSSGSVRLSAGPGWPAGFVGHVDAFTINGQVFDFDVV